MKKILATLLALILVMTSFPVAFAEAAELGVVETKWGLAQGVPGEYAEGNDLGGALAVYSYEADVVGLVVAADDDFCIFPPACAPVANRPVLGIVTKCDSERARTDMATLWLENCGCERIFLTSAKTGQGIEELLAYLK